MDPNAVINRVVRLAKLDTTVFDEVRDDPQELIPALVVAAVSVLLAGLGAWLYWQMVVDFDVDAAFVNPFILGSIFMIIMYGVAALVVYVVMVQMYRVTVDLQSLVRTLGYAALPLSLSVLMFLPIIFPLFAILPIALLFVTMIYAVQSATAADSRQVVMATGAGLGVMILVLGLIALSAGGFQDGEATIGAGIFTLLLDLS